MKNIPKKNVKWLLITLLCIGNMHCIFAQEQKKVTGRVMDAQGELLIGVNVTEAENPSSGVVTDVNGSYTITDEIQRPKLLNSHILDSKIK